MARATIVIREADPDDYPAILQMWAELRRLAGRNERIASLPPDVDLTQRLKVLAEDVNVRILLAFLSDEPVGMAILTAGPPTPLCDQLAVHVYHLYVREPCRRRGAGHALLAAAAAFAEELGAEHVATSVPPHLRDTNRFFARLGFAPVALRRSVPVAALRRQLASSRSSAGDQVVARRRGMKRLKAAVNVSDLAARVTR